MTARTEIANIISIEMNKIIPNNEPLNSIKKSAT
jgi:hypothetical protein